ncbi:MAG TPA: hypothetical protein VK698_23120 [Kofleriaceae bacterium]|nr:hypothetical protein [Kofleriaceae bacterium]
MKGATHLTAIGLSVAISCGTARPVPQELSWAHAAEERLATDGGDGGALYIAAMVERARGNPDGALDLLSRLDAIGWDLGVLDEDFAGLVDSDVYRALARGVAARAPRVHSSEPLFVVDQPTLIPEGIAFDPRTGAYFLGSICERKIVRVIDGVASDLVPSGRDGLGAVLGLHIDARPGGLLWAVHNPARKSGGGWSGLVAVDPRTGALRRHVRLAGTHLLNDIAISDAGDVYVTDSAGGGIHRLRAGRDELTPFIPPGTFAYPNGIAFVPGPARLLVADVLGITVIDVETGARRRLGRGPALSLGAIDGLAIRERTLVAVQNGYGRPRVVRLDLDPAITRVTRVQILEAASDLFDSPTTGVIAGNGFAYIANSQLRRCRDGRLIDPGTLRNPVILRAPLSP